MPERLYNLAARLVARPGADLLGWSGAVAVDHAAFTARMRAWAGLLETLPGRDFALYLDDAIEFGAALLGAWQAGKTIWLAADTLEAGCAALAARVDGFLGDFGAAWAPRRPSAAATAFDGAFARLDGGFAALVVFTSGSTGAAQAIPKRLSQLACEVAALETLFGARAGNAAVVATVSHQHIYGLLFRVLWPLVAGRAPLAHSIAYPEQLAAELARRPSLLVASPAHLKRLPQGLDWQAAAAQLRAVFSSGGPLAPADGQEAAALLGQVPLEVYGSSETGGIAWRQLGQSGDAGWQALPGVAWRIDGDALEVRSPHLPDQHWLQLADRARAGVAGRFELLGRSDRIVKIEEKRISLERIEAALLASDLVEQARVLPCPPVDGQRQALAAVVVLSEQGRAMLDGAGKLALNRLLRAGLGGAVDPVALPRRWRYPAQMPQDAQGKSTEVRLLALFDATRPRRPRLREVERAPQRVLLELTVPADLEYLDGHFPGAPILAGVVQLDWAIAYGRQYFALAPGFSAIHALKFQQVIRPERPVMLELLHDSARSSLNFRYFSAAGQHASGRILFGADAGSVLSP